MIQLESILIVRVSVFKLIAYHKVPDTPTKVHDHEEYQCHLEYAVVCFACLAHIHAWGARWTYRDRIADLYETLLAENPHDAGKTRQPQDLSVASTDAQFLLDQVERNGGYQVNDQDSAPEILPCDLPVTSDPLSIPVLNHAEKVEKQVNSKRHCCEFLQGQQVTCNLVIERDKESRHETRVCDSYEHVPVKVGKEGLFRVEEETFFARGVYFFGLVLRILTLQTLFVPLFVHVLVAED